VAINLIVLAATLLVVGFVVVWACSPRLRGLIESPKYRVLEWPDRRSDGARSRGEAGEEERHR
jgi:hypothetical protein